MKKNNANILTTTFNIFKLEKGLLLLTFSSILIASTIFAILMEISTRLGLSIKEGSSNMYLITLNSFLSQFIYNTIIFMFYFGLIIVAYKILTKKKYSLTKSLQESSTDSMKTVKLALLKSFMVLSFIMLFNATGSIILMFMLLLLVPICYIALFYLLPIVILEDKGIVKSIEKSFHLTKKTFKEICINVIKLYSIFIALLLSIAILAIFIKHASELLYYIFITVSAFSLFIVFTTLQLILETVMYYKATKGKLPLSFNKKKNIYK